MQLLRRIIDFYLESSVHVAFTCFALVKVTEITFNIPFNSGVELFAFFGTIVGYNFVKYDALARTQKIKMSSRLKIIAMLSFLSSILVVYAFFQLQFNTQAIGILVLGLTLLYTLPFFPNRKNARNWAGFKIYIVALCWVGVTLVLPVIENDYTFSSFFLIKCMQRFIFVFVLVLNFEIIDLLHDDPHLKTVPQQIGVKKTKILGYVLLLVFCVLEFINTYFNGKFRITDFLIIIFIAILIALFLLFANEKKSKYYTSFWVESVPFFWLLLLLIFG